MRAIFLFVLGSFFGLRALAGNPAVSYPRETPIAPARLSFQVSATPGLQIPARKGRLYVILGTKSSPQPRLGITKLGLNASPVLACDVSGLSPEHPATLDQNSALFPLNQLSDLPAGDYFVQPLLDVGDELRLPNGPGNFFGPVRKIHLDPSSATPVKLVLDAQIPPEQLPKDSDLVKYIKLPSKLLSAFHHRECFVRAGVILPRDFGRDPARKFPMRIQIGGFNGRFTGVQAMMDGKSPFRSTWLADGTPQFIFVQLDGTGPYGDCYQVNSDNNGPCGDALTQELIPYIEAKYRGNGKRVLNGGSTGGWVALGLQVFYPDVFQGTWVGYPDGVDFRAFELVNIYSDTNAYVNRFGFERPSARTREGDAKFTMRHECQIENVLGIGNTFATSGGQWGAWNAVYGPRGADGLPVPIWNPQTGRIDKSVIEHWKKYDLRMVLEENWPRLAPRLRGKIHVWVGEADDYFLNNAVHLLDEFLSHATPPSEATFQYGPGKGHGWTPFTQLELLKQMEVAVSRE